MVNGAHGASTHADAEEAVVAVGFVPSVIVVVPSGAVLAAVVDDQLVAGLGGLQQRGELLEVGDRLVVDHVDGVAVLQLARRRTGVGDALAR